MTTKRPTKKAPAKAGPIPLRRLTEREVQAHEATSFSWGSDIIPRDATMRTLKAYSIIDKTAEAIITKSVDPFGRFLMDERFRESRLAPAEIVKQARETSEIAKELNQRIQKMDPYIRAETVGRARTVWGETMFPESLQQDLVRLEVVLSVIANEFERIPSTVTKRTGPRNSLLAEMIEIVGQEAAGLTKTKTREIASNLLTVWGVSVPENDNKVRKAIRGRGTK